MIAQTNSRKVISKLTVFTALILVLQTAGFGDEPTMTQQAEILRISRDLARAETLIAEQEFGQAAGFADRAQKRMIKLMSNADGHLIQFARKDFDRLWTVRATLVKKGFQFEKLEPLPKVSELPELADTKTKTKKPTNDSKQKMELTPTKKQNVGAVSFTGDVAKILTSKCGRCHVNNDSGGFSAATFRDLMTGSPAGTVIMPGDANGSRIVEVIEEGDMPRGGLKITADELETLKNWIADGAKFDGDSPNQSLKEMAEPVEMANSKKPTTMAKTANGKGTVRFSLSVAPVLIESCSGCHTGNRTSAGLGFDSFARMMEGGQSGPLVEAGNGQGSLLVQKLRGMGNGRQMPLNDTPLDDEVISKIETWIDEGAKFDGDSQSMSLTNVFVNARAKYLSDAELTEQRVAKAKENWGLVMTGMEPTIHQSNNFIIVSDLNEAELKQLADLAEQAATKVRQFFKLKKRESLLKGKITLYLFQRRYDYSEFGKMIDKRDLNREESSHWNNSLTDSYIAMNANPEEFESSIRADIARLAGSLKTADLAIGAPKWFTNGNGYYIASGFYGREENTKAWIENAQELTRSLSRPDDMLNPRHSERDRAMMGFEFIKTLIANGGTSRYQAIFKSIANGKNFTDAFAESYGDSPRNVLRSFRTKN